MVLHSTKLHPYHQTRLESIVSDKHTSLFGLCVSYEQKVLKMWQLGEML